ncbi:endolysin [Thauera aromatica K172]|uniref:Lysozyme n=2 Tax=Thauera aromatica TaxID=59405 RepID=A0A2R4BNW4_THAAR|nr:endolysin [Thauera aromatica K172]
MHEGYRDTAYDDGVGVQTIGFGTTEGVRPGDRITPERALVRLLADADRTQSDLRACIGPVPMYQHEWDAIVSWAYNVGAGAACKSTLVRRLRAQDYPGACAELLRWTYAGGRELPGLVKRRQAEYQLCVGGV